MNDNEAVEYVSSLLNHADSFFHDVRSKPGMPGVSGTAVTCVCPKGQSVERFGADMLDPGTVPVIYLGVCEGSGFPNHAVETVGFTVLRKFFVEANGYCQHFFRVRHPGCRVDNYFPYLFFFAKSGDTDAVGKQKVADILQHCSCNAVRHAARDSRVLWAVQIGTFCGGHLRGFKTSHQRLQEWLHVTSSLMWASVVLLGELNTYKRGDDFVPVFVGNLYCGMSSQARKVWIDVFGLSAWSCRSEMWCRVQRTRTWLCSWLGFGEHDGLFSGEDPSLKNLSWIHVGAQCGMCCQQYQEPRNLSRFS